MTTHDIAALDVGPEEVASVRLSTGVTVCYTSHGCADAEPLVFLHGWPDSRFSFSRVISLLPPDRFRSIAYDHRGFGDAERPPHGYTIDEFAADALSLLDALGIARATLVGHSFGTFVARRVAELHPSRVARLVLIGSAMTANNEVLREVQRSVDELRDPIPLGFVREFQGSTLQLPVPAAFFDRLVSESRKAPARVWRDTLTHLVAFDDEAELGQIVAPTLLVWGDQDALFASHAEHRRLADLIPNTRLVIYPKTGHSPNWERPERLAGDIHSFLDTVGRSTTDATPR